MECMKCGQTGFTEDELTVHDGAKELVSGLPLCRILPETDRSSESRTFLGLSEKQKFALWAKELGLFDETATDEKIAALMDRILTLEHQLAGRVK